MSDQAPAHRASRGAGRDAKRAARLASAAQTVPFITRKIPFYEVLDDQALAMIEEGQRTTTISFDPNCRPNLVHDKGDYVRRIDRKSVV